MKFSDLQVGDVFEAQFDNERHRFRVMQDSPVLAIDIKYMTWKLDRSFWRKFEDRLSFTHEARRWRNAEIVGSYKQFPRPLYIRWTVGWLIGYTFEQFVPRGEPTAEELDQKLKAYEAELKAYGWED